MLVLNYSHPLTEQHRAEICALTGCETLDVREVSCQVDHYRPIAEQAALAIEEGGLSREEWQTLPLIVNPPALAWFACLVVAEIHGRRGHFPPLLRLRPVRTSLPTQYEVAEIVDLQQVRENARASRAKHAAG